MTTTMQTKDNATIQAMSTIRRLKSTLNFPHGAPWRTAMSKERPIIFSAPMVRAILEGRKSMTRRIVKCREEIACLGTAADWNAGKLDERMPDWETWGPKSGAQVFVGKHGNIFSLNCPYGVPGDRMWVRETWKPHAQTSVHTKAIYRADYELSDGPGGWTPSIYMPRWASRITLEIVSVRVARVQEISEEDAKAEGAERMALDDLGNSWHTRRRGFQALWQSIHGPCSWEQNPWVWVIEFGRIA
jgi:hypothetical protein